jgi:hypothetical protein
MALTPVCPGRPHIAAHTDPHAHKPGGDIDLLVQPDGCPPYPELRANADRIEIDGLPVLIASIDDLIAMKRAAGRPQDLIDLEALEIARSRPD